MGGTEAIFAPFPPVYPPVDWQAEEGVGGVAEEGNAACGADARVCVQPIFPQICVGRSVSYPLHALLSPRPRTTHAPVPALQQIDAGHGRRDVIQVHGGVRHGDGLRGGPRREGEGEHKKK